MNTGQNRMPKAAIRPNNATNCGGMVGDYPLSSVIVVFGVGIGVGVALGSLLHGTPAPRLSFGQRSELATERLGRQIVDAVASVLPTVLSRHIS